MSIISDFSQQYILFRRIEAEGRKLVVPRPPKYGGDMSFSVYYDFLEDFGSIFEGFIEVVCRHMRKSRRHSFSLKTIPTNYFLAI